MADARRDGPGAIPAGRTLFIHIGGPETGTRAVQRFLSLNRKILKARGILYPGTRESHRGIANGLTSHAGMEISPGAPQQLQDLLDEIAKSREPVCIISAEDLAIMGGASSLRPLIPPGFNVRIVYYAGRQDELMESRYSERVKNPVDRLTERLDGDLVEAFYRRRDFDHREVIAPWADAFGRENIIVRCDEMIQMPDGVITDFCRIIDLAPDRALKVPAGPVNGSLGVDHTEFIRLCNARLPDMPEINPYLEGEFRNSRALDRVPDRHWLSPGQRSAIIDHYRRSNEQVAREYLGRKDGRLFFSPGPDPAESWEPYHGLTPETLVPMIAELFYHEARWELPRQPLRGLLRIANSMLMKIPGASLQGRERAQSTRHEVPGSADEFVPEIAAALFRRRLKAERARPLAVIFSYLNHILVIAGCPVSPKTQRRIYRMFFSADPGDSS